MAMISEDRRAISEQRRAGGVSDATWELFDCPCVKRRDLRLHGNYARANVPPDKVTRIVFDPLPSRLYAESRTAILPRLARTVADLSLLLACGRRRRRFFFFTVPVSPSTKANIPADNTKDPIVQAATILYIELAGEMKYVAKRHVQFVCQMVRRIKHADGSTGKLMNMKILEIPKCVKPCGIIPLVCPVIISEMYADIF